MHTITSDGIDYPSADVLLSFDVMDDTGYAVALVAFTDSSTSTSQIGGPWNASVLATSAALGKTAAAGSTTPIVKFSRFKKVITKFAHSSIDGDEFLVC